MKTLLLFFLCFLTINTALWAQDEGVSGVVTSSEDGSALPGVNVVVKGTTTGSVTDIDGNFKLAVPTNSILVFSFIGYTAQEIPVNGRSEINVALAPDVTQLGEVVVTAVAIERETRSLGYSVESLGSAELTKARETNVVNSLQGKVAGVQIVNSGGTLGGSSKILVRGAAAMSDNIQPLWVVDGVPVFNSNRTSLPGGGGDVRFNNDYDYGNTAADINPDDIESITVLKGSTAAALYGQRARNGAIVITTKKGGSTSGRTSVTINSSVRLDNPFKKPDYQNIYGPGQDGRLLDNTFRHWGPRVSGQVVPGNIGNWERQDGPLTIYPENFENFYETGITLINSAAISGGNENTNFRLGYTNRYQEGITPNTELASNTISINAGTKLANKIRASVGLQFVNTNSDGRSPSGSGNDLSSLIYSMPNTYDIRDLRDFKTEFDQQRPLNDENDNPYWLLFENRFDLDRDRLIGNVNVQWDPVEWLNLSARVGHDFYTERRFSRNRKTTILAPEGSFFQDVLEERQFNLDLLATVKKDITNDLNVQTILGFNVNQRKFNQDLVRGADLVIDQLYVPSNANNVTTTTDFEIRRLLGAFFDVGFNYKDYLFLNVTGRNDWSSTLPKENRSFFYPSVSSSFVFTDAFNLGGNILSYGKVRASWAQVGSDTEPFQLDFLFEPVSDIFYVLSGGGNNTFPFNGQLALESTDVIPPLNNLKPEIQNSFELGAELQFFNNRLGIDFTYYNIVTTDQIVDIDIPISSGFIAKRLNVGETENTGLELSLTGTPLSTNSGFQWDVGVNLSTFEQKVNKLADGLEEFNLTGGLSGLQIKARPGESFGLFVTDFETDPETGQYIMNDQGLRVLKENVRAGDVYPELTAGLQNTFSFKGVSLSFLVDWKKGGVLHSGTVEQLRALGLAEETADRREELFVDPGLIQNADGTFRPNDVPISREDWWDNNTDAEGFSTFDADYVKLREARLSYNLPSQLLKSTPFGTARVALEGRNLLLLYSKVPHIDPEANLFGAGDAGGAVEIGGVPSTRSFGMNLTLTF